MTERRETVRDPLAWLLAAALLGAGGVGGVAISQGSAPTPAPAALVVVTAERYEADRAEVFAQLRGITERLDRLLEREVSR